MGLREQLEPRDRVAAARSASVMLAIAAVVTQLFAGVETPWGFVELTVMLVLPVGLMILALLSRISRNSPALIWGTAPVVGVILIAVADLATQDATAAGQVFFCLPVLFAASQLRMGAAFVTAGLAVVAEIVVTLAILPPGRALIDIVYVSTTLLAMTAVLVIAGRRQDALVERLHRLVATDPLTGLATRRVLDDAAARALAVSLAEDRRGTALIVVDVDHFKHINDRLGHPVGDSVLIHLASVIGSCARPGDVVCRLGGDEIALLLPNCTPSTAAQRAEDLVAAVRSAPFVLPDGSSHEVSISAGVAHAHVHTGALHDLYASADASLYAAKNAGRDQVGELA